MAGLGVGGAEEGGVASMLLDEEDKSFDQEVAAVLSRGLQNEPDSYSGQSPCHGFTPATHNYSPFRPSTALTNVTRGNIRTTTPCMLNVLKRLSVYQLAAQGELIYMELELQEQKVNSQDEQGYTPLIWAAANNQSAMLEYLLTRGAYTNLAGHQGETALIFATSSGFTNVATLLLEAGADVNVAATAKDSNTALMYASMCGHVDCVQLLLDWGADVSMLNDSDRSAIDIAVVHGQKKVQRAIERHLVRLLGMELPMS